MLAEGALAVLALIHAPSSACRAASAGGRTRAPASRRTAGHGTKYLRWSLRSYSRLMREVPLISGVDARNFLARKLNVRARASASATGSPSLSTSPG